MRKFSKAILCVTLLTGTICLEASAAEFSINFSSAGHTAKPSGTGGLHVLPLSEN